MCPSYTSPRDTADDTSRRAFLDDKLSLLQDLIHLSYSSSTNQSNTANRANKSSAYAMTCTFRDPAISLNRLKSPTDDPTSSILQCRQNDFSAKCRLHHASNSSEGIHVTSQCRRDLLVSSLAWNAQSLAAGCASWSSAPAQAGEEVCLQCRGSGAVPCGLCDGTGQWLSSYQNGIPVREKCPQCEGKGQLRCVLCLGTGLRNTSGLLRGPAVKEGRLRIRGDGSIEILDCDYFPATRGKQCRVEGVEGESDTNLLTEERADRAKRGDLYPRRDLV